VLNAFYLEAKMLQIAIDGPSGSGKSSIAKIVAGDLGLTYLDTGAMYRAVTLYLLTHDIDLTAVTEVELALDNVHIHIDQNITYLNGENVSDAIRTPIIDLNVSLISSYAFVRKRMVALQQKIAENTDVILDGRDIGSVVLPRAQVKIFLTASPEVRAKRRMLEFEKKGISMTYDEVLADIVRRDHLDSTRDASPLSIPDGARIVDTSHMTFDEVITSLIQLIKEVDHGTEHY
jgi:cytidylate kinase